RIQVSRRILGRRPVGRQELPASGVLGRCVHRWTVRVLRSTPRLHGFHACTDSDAGARITPLYFARRVTARRLRQGGASGEPEWRGGAASPTIRPGRIRDLQKGVHVNRSQLVAEAAKRTGLEEKAVDAALRGILEVVAGVVAKGKDKVTIPGWVGFEQGARAARKARNPQTGGG